LDERLQAIKEELGPAYYESSDVLLYQGDCVELMGRLSGSSVDLTVTSPPYNIGKEYERILPLAEYVTWCGKWMGQVYELTAPRGSFWLNVGYVPVPDLGKAVPLTYLLWNQSPFYLIQEVVWNYGAGVAARHSFSPRNEKLLWYVRNRDDYYFDLDAVRDPDVKYPNQKKNGKLKCNQIGKNPSDVWQIAKVTSGTDRASKERTPHPAQFPTVLVQRVIQACSPKGGLVLDPFIGSGTTAAVAREHGRLCVGFDLRADYLDIAISRLEQSLNVLF
jgi:adenine-specific DNA-methyltransferase